MAYKFGWKVAGVAVLGLTACSDMRDQYRSGIIVLVDGVEHLVRPLPGQGNNYQAMENDPAAGQADAGSDATIYDRNIRAIREATGCSVDADSISQSEGQTIAAVAC